MSPAAIPFQEWRFLARTNPTTAPRTKPMKADGNVLSNSIDAGESSLSNQCPVPMMRVWYRKAPYT
jgi:hypothetical protein